MQRHFAIPVIVLFFAAVSILSRAATPTYTFSPSGHDGAGGQSCVAADPFHPGIIVAGGDIWGLWRSTDYGRDFQAVSVPVPGDDYFSSGPNFKIAAVKFSLKTPNRVYAGVGILGTSGGFLRSDDGGLTWDRVSTQAQFSGQKDGIGGTAGHPRAVGNLIAIDASTATEYIYGGTFIDGVKRSSDAGNTWSAGMTMPGLTLGTNTYIRGIAIDDINPQTVYAGLWDTDGDGNNESVYKITNARTATACTLVENTPFKRAEEMVVVNGLLYVAANDDTASKRGIYRYDGTSWTKIYDDGGATEWYSIDGYWTGSNAVIYAGSADNAKSEPGTNPTLHRSVMRSDNAQAATPGWTYLSKSNARIHVRMPMGDATGDIWWHSTEGVAAQLGGDTFVACQTLIDPSDPTHKRVYVCGRAGMWRTDDGTVSDPYWYPCVRHMNGPVVNYNIADPNNVNRAYTIDTDWCFLYSTDKMSHFTRRGTSVGGGVESALAVDSTTNPSGISPLYFARGNDIAYSPDAATTNFVSTNMPGSNEVKGVSVKYLAGTGTVCLAG